MLRRALLFSTAFVVAVAAGRSALIPQVNIALFWPAAGVLTWWALRARSRSELGLIIAAIFAVITPWFALSGFPLHAALLVSVANTVTSVGTRFGVIALARRRIPRGRSLDGPEPEACGWYVFRLARATDLYRLQIAAFAAVVLGALVGTASIYGLGTTPTFEDYLSWTFRNLSGIVVIAGVGLAATTSDQRFQSPGWVPLLGLAATTVGAFVVVFWVGMSLPVGFAALLPLFWSAIRMPITVAAIHSAVVSLTMIALSVTVHESPFGDTADPWFVATSVQIFALLAVSFALTVSIAVHESRRLYAEVREHHEITRRQAADLEAITETIPDGLVIVAPDGRVEFVNRAGAEFVTPAPDAEPTSGVRGRIVGALTDLTGLPTARALRGESVRGHEVAIVDGASGNRVYDVSAAPLYRGDDDRPDRALLLFRDVTERHHAAAETENARQHAQRLFSDAPQGIVELDGCGRILSANIAFAHLTGRDATELVGSQLADLASDAGHLREYLDDVLASPGAQLSTDCSLDDRADGARRVSLSSRVLDSAGSQTIVMHVVDVSERSRYEQLLSHLADHDALTGLANRRLFDIELALHMERYRDGGPGGAMLLIDLDHFKEVNDTLGHSAGDDLLVSIAGLLRSTVRGTDVVARLGGDEFAVILPGADGDAVAAIASSLVEGIRGYTREVGGAASHVTASIGAVTFAAAESQRTDPLVLADMLMYDAKESGRDTSVVLAGEGGERPRTGTRIEWKHRLEKALAEGHLVLHLQPILDLTTDRVVAAEALVRLRDGDAIIPPGTFVPIAEEVGLAPALDLWVIGEALALLPDLVRHDPHFRLSVNVSGRSIGDPSFTSAVATELEADTANAARLMLELTETAVVDEVGTARAFAESISPTGVRFALDDFGAGYGSFYYLKHLVFDYIKIDGEFVAELDSSAVDRSIVKSIVGVAQELGKGVIAEYVSTPEVLELVRSKGITYAQGFEVGRPVPVDAFIATHLAAAPVRPAGDA